jgi:hypothetical protein
MRVGIRALEIFRHIIEFIFGQHSLQIGAIHDYVYGLKYFHKQPQLVTGCDSEDLVCTNESFRSSKHKFNLYVETRRFFVDLLISPLHIYWKAKKRIVRSNGAILSEIWPI